MPRGYVAVYCGSRVGASPAFRAAAAELGAALARENWGLVYGGGKIGLMGVIADAVLANGGTAWGIMPQFLVDKEQAHRGLSRLDIVTTMHERKAQMIAAADHFVALPGGVGTLEEVYEALSWRHLDLIKGTVSLLNVDGFYDGAAELFARILADGFLPSAETDILHVARETEELIALWEQYSSDQCEQ